MSACDVLSLIMGIKGINPSLLVTPTITELIYNLTYNSKAKIQNYLSF